MWSEPWRLNCPSVGRIDLSCRRVIVVWRRRESWLFPIEVAVPRQGAVSMAWAIMSYRAYPARILQAFDDEHGQRTVIKDLYFGTPQLV
mmetsp:Transcript_143368/g.458247  ORF Transcript_143368/g.458247 Transcript_143368/m.458247 type:complete len:89 (-) Transcript_143368:1421-1687(-)